MRLTVTPLTLSTGQRVPPGASIGFFSMGINESPTLYTSPPPEVFDGFRFARMRQNPGEEDKHQFGSTGLSETLDFGHGMHACPVSSSYKEAVVSPGSLCPVQANILEFPGPPLCSHGAQDRAVPSDLEL